jgi:hypothetical protein
MSARKGHSSPRPFKDQSGAWRNGTSFGPNDLEALVTVAHEAKQIGIHCTATDDQSEAGASAFSNLC